MQKIMFNDQYHLTDMVLDGLKKQTRRNAKEGATKTRFSEGEVVAIAQKYASAGLRNNQYGTSVPLPSTPGWSNKMFVRAEMMPHRIRIESAGFQNLQDITDMDCFEEGIAGVSYDGDMYYTYQGSGKYWKTPREAYASLIDKISGKGTWDKNERVEAYKFTLIQ